MAPAECCRSDCPTLSSSTTPRAVQSVSPASLIIVLKLAARVAIDRASSDASAMIAGCSSALRHCAVGAVGVRIAAMTTSSGGARTSTRRHHHYPTISNSQSARRTWTSGSAVRADVRGDSAGLAGSELTTTKALHMSILTITCSSIRATHESWHASIKQLPEHFRGQVRGSWPL